MSIKRSILYRCLHVGLCIGLFLSLDASYAAGKKAGKKESNGNRYQQLELFQKVLQFASKNYVEPVSDEKLIQGAIQGMMDALDPHSNFLSPEIYREMKSETEGKFGGVGLEVGMKDSIITVVAPMEDSPAWKAGIRTGDKLVRIENESTKGMNLTEAVQKMRGKPGSVVKVRIFKESSKTFKDLTLKREIIRMKGVHSEYLQDGIAYIRLNSFSESATRDILKEISKFEKNTKQPFSSLILDLRNNPGGLLDQAVDLSSVFLDEGVVVSTIGRDPNQKEVRAVKTGGAKKDIRLAVLINSGSASASEIVAAALQDHKRAIILGEPSFGKGSVQTVIPLGNDLGLKLTIAKYYSPSGRSIQESGVIPDVLIEEYDPALLKKARILKEKRREKDLKGHLKKDDYSKEELMIDVLNHQGDEVGGAPDDDQDEPKHIDPKSDFQVLEAIRILKSFEVFKKIK